MLTPEFLAASIIALGIGHAHESALRAREFARAWRAEVRSRRGRRTRKRGVPERR